MTIPETISFPLHTERIREGGAGLDDYMRDLVFSLQDMYETVAEGVNGTIQTEFSIGSEKFAPIISGTTDAGAGTYDHQVGWVHRKGVFTEVWFDVQWSAHTGTGDMCINLPFLVTKSEQKPFVGVVQASNITYPGDYLVCNAIPDTRRLEIWDVTTAVATANVAIDAAGQLIGHVRYVGQEIELS